MSREIHDLGIRRKTRYSWLVNHIRDKDGKASRIVELVETESLGTPGCEWFAFPAWTLDELVSEFGPGKVAKLYQYDAAGTPLFKCCVQYGKKAAVHAVETCFADSAALCLLDWRRKFKAS